MQLKNILFGRRFKQENTSDSVNAGAKEEPQKPKQQVNAQQSLNLMNCAQVKKYELSKPVKSFSYEYTEAMNFLDCYTYSFDFTKSKELTITMPAIEDKDYKVKLTKEEKERVLELLAECKVEEWDGYNEKDEACLDGFGFSFYLEFEDGTLINARGSNAAPRTHYDLHFGLYTCFDSYRAKFIEKNY